MCSSVLVETGGARRREFTKSLMVGRDSEVGLVLPELAVSSHHAILEWIGGTCYVRDLGSTNGTTLNGRPVTDRVALNLHDSLCFGRVSTWRVEELNQDEVTGKVHTLSINSSLELEATDKNSGWVRIFSLATDPPRLVGQRHLSAGFMLLDALSPPGEWIEDGPLFRDVWGDERTAQNRGRLQVLVERTNELLVELGAPCRIIEKASGKTRMNLPRGLFFVGTSKGR